jgi:hypothetical protein
MMFRSTNRSRGGDPRIRDLEAGSNTNSGPRLKEGKVAVQAASPSQAPVDNGNAYAAEDARGYGWVAFAGTLLLMLGTLNFIEGLAAIGNSHFFVNNTHYIVGNLNTWGWIVLCIGVAEWLVGVGVFVKNQFSRWAGVLVLGLNSIAQLLMMPAYPFWSLTIFTLDILAIYGLVAYGRRISSAE